MVLETSCFGVDLTKNLELRFQRSALGKADREQNKIIVATLVVLFFVDICLYVFFIL